MTTDTSYNQTELLQKIAEGDQHAFKVIYKKFNKKIYTSSLQIVKTTVIAEEVTQEVFLKLWLQDQRFNDFDYLEAWLRTTARNLSLNAFRKLVSERTLSQTASEQSIVYHNDTEESLLLHDARKLLDTAIENLPGQQREIYMLCHQDGLKYEDVAKKLGISVNTVKTHMKRALASLRTYMKARTDIVVLIILLKLF